LAKERLQNDIFCNLVVKSYDLTTWRLEVTWH